jgi:hypothetical protein
MYDSISTGTQADKTKAVGDKLAIDFDLSSVPFYAEDEECGKKLPSPEPESAYMWANDMVEKGVAGEGIQFLVQVLNPDPNARLTVRDSGERVFGMLIRCIIIIMLLELIGRASVSGNRNQQTLEGLKPFVVGFQAYLKESLVAKYNEICFQ